MLFYFILIIFIVHYFQYFTMLFKSIKILHITIDLILYLPLKIT